MILKGNEDLRIVKTIEGIKSAFEELICEKDYEKITVKELCDKARINKIKTEIIKRIECAKNNNHL